MKNPKKSAPATDAISMLKKDHREMEKSFAEFKQLAKGEDTSKKKALADHIGDELLTHMAIEEDVFYCAVEEEMDGAESEVNEGFVEHDNAKNMITQIHAMKGTEELFDSKVKVLSELIEHHVEEEEKEMFPKVKKSSLDLEALGQEMADHKAQL